MKTKHTAPAFAILIGLVLGQAAIAAHERAYQAGRRDGRAETHHDARESADAGLQGEP